jgi:hypothetical protein
MRDVRSADYCQVAANQNLVEIKLSFCQGSHQVAPENSGSAHIRAASSHRIAQISHLLSEFNNLHVYPVWHMSCLTTNVVARTTKEATHDKRSEQELYGACGR